MRFSPRSQCPQPPICRVRSTGAAALAAHRKASRATSDQDFATVEKNLDILWTNA